MTTEHIPLKAGREVYMANNFDDNPYDPDNPYYDDGGRGGQGRGRGRGRNRGRGGGGIDAADLAADPRFKYRLLSNLVQLISNKLGEAGYETAWSHELVRRLSGSVEEIVGWLRVIPGAESFFSSFIAASIQSPQAFKDALRRMGVNEEYIAMSDEAIDNFIHGIGQAHARKGKVTVRDEEAALRAAEVNLQNKLGQAVDFPTALLTLPPSQQLAFSDKYQSLARLDAEAATNRAAALQAMLALGQTTEQAEAALGPKAEHKKTFDGCRDKIKGPRREVVKLLETLIQLEAHEWHSHLKLLYGEPKPPSQVAKLMGKVTKAANEFAGKAVDRPGDGFRSAAEIVGQGTSALDDWNRRLEADTARRRRGRR